MTAVVNADLFRIVAGFISTEETRYYLNGVYVHKHQLNGVVMVATDGHRLMIAHDPNGTTTLDGVIVRLDKATMAATKAAKGEHVARVLEIHGNGEVRVLAGPEGERRAVAIQHAAIVDGTFPDYRRVIPTPDKFETPWFNATYVKDFANAAQELAKLDGRKDGLPFRLTGPSNGPAIVQYAGRDDIFGVLMPVRGVTEVSLAWFLDAAPAPAQIAA